MIMLRRQDDNGPVWNRVFELLPDAAFIQCTEYDIDIQFVGEASLWSYREYEEGSEIRQLLLDAWTWSYDSL